MINTFVIVLIICAIMSIVALIISQLPKLFGNNESVAIGGYASGFQELLGNLKYLHKLNNIISKYILLEVTVLWIIFVYVYYFSFGLLIALLLVLCIASWKMTMSLKD